MKTTAVLREATQPQPQPQVPAARLPDIDLLKGVAALGIVCYHATAAWHAVTYAGLVVFVALTAALALKSGLAGERPVRRRAARFLLPWLFWWLVYAAVNAVSGAPIVELRNGLVAGLLTGPSVHLWYLPFAYCTVCAVDAAAHCLDTRALRWLPIALAASALALAAVWRPASLAAGYPWAQYLHAAPAVAIGVHMATFRRHSLSLDPLAASLLALACLVSLDVAGVGVPYLVGVAAAFLFTHLLRPLLRERDFGWLSSRLLGVYLLHPLFIRAIRHFVDAPGLLLPLLAALSTFVAVGLVQRAAPGFARRFM